MKKLIFSLLACVAFAFQGNAQDLRYKFLEGKSRDEVISQFNQLSVDQKNDLWLEKINQILSQDIPSTHKELIGSLKEELKKIPYSSKSDKFVEVAVGLAEITPLEDFILMFESLKDYKFAGKFNSETKVPAELLKDIKSINNPISNTTTADRPCSCRWCIGMGTTSGNCTPSDGGCGFLWMQDCTRCVLCL